MTAEINELFEEGITRSSELTDAADQVMNAIDAMAKEAEDLAQRVQDEGSEACQHLRDLVARLSRAEDAIDEARGQAEAALDGLSGQAGEVKDEAGHLLERVKKCLADLESQAGRTEASLETHGSAVQHDFQDLAQKTQEADTHIQEQLQQASAAIGAFSSAIEAAQGAVAQKQGLWSAAAEALESAVREHADELAAALTTLMGRAAAATVQMTNSMVEDHNGAMEHIRHLFEDQAPQELTSALQPLEHGLEHLGGDAQQRMEALRAEQKEFETLTQHMSTTLDGIAHALQSTARLE